MNELELDKAFEKFLDDEECERVNEAVFSLVQNAFTAGWVAAMGSDLKAVMDVGRTYWENEAEKEAVKAGKKKAALKRITEKKGTEKKAASG